MAEPLPISTDVLLLNGIPISSQDNSLTVNDVAVEVATSKGVANGYCPLNESGVIPVGYLPDTPTNLDGGDLGA